jgi:hypothetical protein
LSRYSATFSARTAAPAAPAALMSARWMMFTAPSDPMTAISAEGHAKLKSARMCLLAMTQ